MKYKKLLILSVCLANVSICPVFAGIDDDNPFIPKPEMQSVRSEEDIAQGKASVIAAEEAQNKKKKAKSNKKPAAPAEPATILSDKEQYKPKDFNQCKSYVSLDVTCILNGNCSTRYIIPQDDDADIKDIHSQYKKQEKSGDIKNAKIETTNQATERFCYAYKDNESKPDADLEGLKTEFKTDADTIVTTWQQTSEKIKQQSAEAKPNEGNTEQEPKSEENQKG